MRAAAGTGWLVIAGLVAAMTVAEAAEARDPAASLYGRAQQNVLEGSQEKALEKFRTILREYPASPFAAQAQWQVAELYARNREYAEAFAAGQRVVEKFPQSDLFAKAVETQFTIAERVADEYRKRRLKGDKSTRGLPDRETASAMFRVILANGRHTDFAPRAKYRLAAALDVEQNPSEAVREFSAFLDNYPRDPLADDAAFQIGFIEYRLARQTNQERGARERAQLGLEYFLVRFPESEKAPEARHLLGLLAQWEGQNLLEAAKFYDREAEAALRKDRPAKIAPDSAQAERLKLRIDELQPAAANALGTAARQR